MITQYFRSALTISLRSILSDFAVFGFTFSSITLLIFTFKISSLHAEERLGAVERRNQELIRASGFADVELDRLHQHIGQLIAELQPLAVDAELLPDAKPELTQPKSTSLEQSNINQNSIELQPSLRRSFVKGIDSNGKTYFRLRIKEGLNYTMQPQPDRFVFRAHAFFYLDENNKLSKVLVQFYRLKFSGLDYTRELRRISHPGPFADGARQSAMKIEFQSFPKGLSAKDLSVDGIPLPVLSVQPELTAVLQSTDEQIPFDKQVRIIETYRSLLRKLDRQLDREKHILQLTRDSDIERTIDFTGTSY